jgi:hypothetical protein
MTVVDITAILGGTLIEDIEAAGGAVLSVNARYNTLRARISLDQLESIAASSQVRFIQPRQEFLNNRISGTISAAFSPASRTERTAGVRAMLSGALGAMKRKRQFRPQVGSTLSEGDATHRADDARDFFGITGAGVKIGVLSDGVENLASSQASGDLPPVTVLPGQIGSGDEGTAMLELIHDLAPGAELFFATALPTITTFADNIRLLRSAGCDIIVDDILYFVETPFHDGQAAGVVSNTNGGVVTQAVNDVTADGALFFSSAGNSGNKNDETSGVWEGDFVDGICSFSTAPEQSSSPRQPTFRTVPRIHSNRRLVSSPADEL